MKYAYKINLQIEKKSIKNAISLSQRNSAKVNKQKQKKYTLNESVRTEFLITYTI